MEFGDIIDITSFFLAALDCLSVSLSEEHFQYTLQSKFGQVNLLLCLARRAKYK